MRRQGKVHDIHFTVKGQFFRQQLFCIGMSPPFIGAAVSSLQFAI